MTTILKKVVIFLLKIIQFIFSPIFFLTLIIFRVMRLAGYENFKFTKKLFFLSGVLPITDYCYEPFSKEKIKFYKNEKREIKSFDYNIEEQLEMIKNFHYQEELLKLPREKINIHTYFYNNDNFTAGDADYYYSLIRYLKPKRIIEIGSGFSTLLALEAIKINQIEKNDYYCQLTCIEPYEFKWLKNKNVNFIESLVENVELDVFKTLESNDILFIDSSHIIKPKGDLLYIFMGILPVLKSGVFIHFHDIFSPWDYPEHWIRDKLLFWNEQYLLEVFLSHNKNYKVICSLNFLKNNYWDYIKNYLPVLNEYPNKEPGSFWIIKN